MLNYSKREFGCIIMATLPGLVKDASSPPTDTQLSPISVPDGTTLLTTKQHNQIVDYLSGDAGPDFIPQAAIDSLVVDLAARELTANKGAINGYAGLDASQELLLANFPTGAALQVLRRNAGNTALEFADPAAGGGITSINGDTTAAQILAGTTNRISLVDAGATHTFDIDAAYVGQTSITTLGTITTGVWNGTDIALANIVNGTANQIIKTNAGGTALEFGLIGDANTDTFTTTKITTLSKSLLNTEIVYNNQSNVFGDFTQTFKDNSITIESPNGLTPTTLVNAQQTLARNLTIPILTANRSIVVTGEASQITIGTEVTGASTDLTDTAVIARSTNNLSFFAATTSAQLAGVIDDETGSGLLVFGTSPTIVTPTIASFVNAAHNHQDAAGGGQLDSTLALSDTADIAYLNTANAWTTGLQNFAAVTLRIPVSATPSVIVDGDIAYDTTVTDFTTGLIRFFGTEEQGIVAMPIAQFTTPSDGAVPTYNATNDEFELVVPAGAGDMILAAVQTVTGAKTFGTIGGAVGKFILAGSTSGSTILNAAAVAGSTTVTLQGVTGTLALLGDKLDAFAATTSTELATVISDETGSGLLVFGTSPTIVTPTIASFTNATHDHEDAAGGGTLLSTAALSDTADIAYLNTANTYVAGTRQDFLGLLAGTSGLNVGAIAGNPTTQVDGDVWYNSTSNTLFGRVNGVDINLGQSGAEVTTWTADHSMATFKLTAQGGNDVILNAPSNRGISIEEAGSQEYLFDATEANFLSNNIINLGTLNTHTIPGGTSTFALFSDNLSVFAATTSLQLLGVISDETGSGLLVFGTSPTIITPTIASFINATHDHSDAAGGGNLTNTALTSGVFAAITGVGIQTQALDLGGFDVDNIQNLIYDISTSGIDIDFLEDTLQTISIAADTTFTTANIVAGKSKTLKITTDGTLRTLDFPAWDWVSDIPTDQAANKNGYLTLTAYGVTDASIVAAYQVGFL